MTQRADRAKELFLEGYNCCQAVVGAFSDCIDLEFDVLMKIASSFGGGMGRMREVCGAVSGMFLAAGYLAGYSDPKAKEQKAEHYRLIQELANEFKRINSSIVCRDLLGEKDTSYVPSERTETYYQKRPCADLVWDAAMILAKRFQL